MFWRDLYGVSRPLHSMLTELQRLQSDMERLYSGVTRPLAPEFPALNLWSNQDGALLTAELPGMSENDIDISVRGSSITISGERKDEENVEFHRKERASGKFTRTLDLPFQVDADKVEARLVQGILEVRLPRAEADKPRKIAISN